MEVVWFDQDVIECRVTCSNGPFCGATKMYLAHDELLKAADTLARRLPIERRRQSQYQAWCI